MKKSITPAELEAMLCSNRNVQILDVRLPQDRTPVTHDVPGACWRDPNQADSWSSEISAGVPVVVYCVHGLRVSQGVQQKLSSLGFDASILEGGIDAWEAHVERASPKVD